MEKQKLRSRTKARPTGVDRHGFRLDPLPLLTLLNTYRALPTHYIKAAITNATDLMTFCSQEGYIRIPHQLPARYGKKLSYEFARGEPKRPSTTDRLFMERGGILSDRTHDQQFNHSYLTALAQFLFDFAPREIAGLAKLTPNYKFPFELRPDAPLFGYQLGSRYFYLAGFEADMGTEQQHDARELGSANKQTIESKIRTYDRFFAERDYRRHNIRNCSAAFICIGEARAANIIKLIREKSSKADRYVVTWLPDFRRYEFAEPSATMLTREWLTAKGTTSIMEVLNGHQPYESADRAA